ncbi:MAG: hypothetical protein ACI9JL_004259 [Paracoccaceae bacterium]|jgi:hypothetical protein
MYDGCTTQQVAAQTVCGPDNDRLEASLWSPVPDPGTELNAKTALVGFPVAPSGADGPIIPFDRYSLVLDSELVSHSAAGTEIRAALVRVDGSGVYFLSAQQLGAMAQDPDVTIF